MTECASTNTIAALLAGAIDSAAAHRLEGHLDACATCRRLVADLGRGLSAIGAGPGARWRVAEIGDRVGRFEIDRVIGVGGMGVVFEARDPTLERRVAVKLLRPDIVAGEMLLGEAQAMARLQHPNIAVVHDVGKFGGQLYFCMEYIAGSTLRAWLGERDRSWREIVDVFVAAGRGLAYVHGAGLVHRDFKPDNVLIGRDGRVVVTDFGLARVVDRGRVVGTPAYMPPEQRRGERVDARADQYAFCVALRESAGDRAPAWLRRILAHGLAERAADRVASMDALLAAIDAQLRRRSRAISRAAVVIAVVAIALLAFPRARDVVTHVIDRPIVERIVETRAASTGVAGEDSDELAADREADARDTADLGPAMLAALTPRTISRRSIKLADARPLAISAPTAPRLIPRARSSCPAASRLRPAATTAASASAPSPNPPARRRRSSRSRWLLDLRRRSTCAPLGVPAPATTARSSRAPRARRSATATISSVHRGCWRCDDPFACLAIAVGGLPRRCGNFVCEPGRIRCRARAIATAAEAARAPVPEPVRALAPESGSGSGSGSETETAACRAATTTGSASRRDPRQLPFRLLHRPARRLVRAVCGNLMCETGESHASCPQDCP